MLAGMSKEEKQTLNLNVASDYIYLNQVFLIIRKKRILNEINIFQLDGTIYCDSRDDAKEWSTIKSACKVLMFSADELNDILRLLSAVLHLGNLKFEGEFNE